MSVVRLYDEENYAILTETFTESLGDLNDKSRQLSVLKRIYALLDSDHPQHFIYETPEGVDKLQVIRAGDDLRIFSRLVMGVPEEDTMYNVLYCFYVDPHEYRYTDLEQYNSIAKARMRTLKGYDSPGEVKDHLDEQNAFTAADIKQRIDRA